MDTRIVQLIDLIDETKRLLRTYGEERWAAWLERNERFIRNRNFYGIEQLLSGYSGMGSFNDVVIHPSNRHRIQAHEVAHVNEHFQELKDKMYMLADELRREEQA